MKNLKKLVIASFMLVIAFVAVVSSTYAWFTTSDEAKVNEITIGVVDASAALLISEDGNRWSSTVDVMDNIKGKFTPVTLTGTVSDPIIKQLNGNYVYGTDSVYNLYNGANENGKGYLAFDLYFRVEISSGLQFENFDIAMNIIDLQAGIPGDETGDPWTPNISAKSSFRLAVAEYTANGSEIKAIAEGEGNGRYNSGNQFEATNPWMELYAGIGTNKLVQPIEEVSDETTTITGYKLVTDADVAMCEPADVTTPVNGALTKVISDGDEYRFHCANVSHSTSLDDIQTNDIQGFVKIRIYVWMEGWDGDNMNDAASCQYAFKLQFNVVDHQ